VRLIHQLVQHLLHERLDQAGLAGVGGVDASLPEFDTSTGIDELGAGKDNVRAGSVAADSSISAVSGMEWNLRALRAQDDAATGRCFTSSRVRGPCPRGPSRWR
jgi:hypothetical protein